MLGPFSYSLGPTKIEDTHSLFFFNINVNYKFIKIFRAILREETLPELSVSEASTTRQAGHNSISDWSRVSSADSLEWDPVQSPLHCTPPGSIDTDTQQLLHEIELLTDQALRETGRTFDS